MKPKQKKSKPAIPISCSHRVAVQPSVRVNSYSIISRAVENGVGYGIRRAYKYADEKGPTEDALNEHIEREVMNALCDVLIFDNEQGEA